MREWIGRVADLNAISTVYAIIFASENINFYLALFKRRSIILFVENMLITCSLIYCIELINIF